jgi:penicillin amidase
MRSFFVAAAWLSGAWLCGCGSTSNGVTPSLTITPSGNAGPVLITSPTDFTAQLVGSTADIAWTVSGGTLSGTSGRHVVYIPPPGTAMGTLTATAGNLTASVMISSSPVALKPVSIPGLKGAVTVQYDAQDVPHIQCTQAVDCVAVQGYLQARDRWFPMDFLRHVAEGHLAELIGTSGLSSDLQLRTLFTTRAGHRLEDDLRQALAQDQKTLDLLTAFTAGVNAYLTELKASKGALPGEYAQLPFPLTPDDIAPWRIEDTLAVGRLNQFQLSETLTAETNNGKFALTYGPGAAHADPGKMNAWIRAAAPPSEQAHTLAPTGSHVSSAAAPTIPASGRGPGANLAKWRGALNAAAARAAALRDRLRPADASVGSNNWVVAKAKSGASVSMVANDPHLSLQYPPLFHLAALTSSNPTDHLNITGGSFPGVPGALVGRGERVGWGVTVVGYDVTDVYMETFPDVKDCPGAALGIPCVKFKGNNVSVVAIPTTAQFKNQFLVRVGPGETSLVDAATLDPKKLPVAIPPALLIVPHHGPVISVPPDLARGTGGAGLSVRWTGHEGNTLDSKAFYGLSTATDVDAAMVALKDYATGAQNFVLADDQGNIAYDPHALVPIRRFADARVTPGDQLKPPWFPLPGDGSAEWGDGVSDCANPTAVPASCWIPDDQLPQGKNPAKGYFFTANADPTSLPGNAEKGVSDDNSPLAHPPYLSFDWDDSSGFRATRIEQMMKDAIAAHGNVTADDMMKIQSDHVSRIGLAFAPIIAGIAASNPSGAPPEFGLAANMLAAWTASNADCPSGLTGTDPRGAADAAPAVVASSSACFLFHEFLRLLVSNVFTDDLVVAGQGVNGLAAVKALLFMFTPEGAGSTSFCNDVNPATGQVTTRSCAAQVVTALAQAYGTLRARVGSDPNTWVWGRVHTMQPVSLLALVTSGYSPGPFARPGGAFTVDVGSPSLAGSGLDFSFGSSGNVRHISLMDPARPVVKMQLPGPERDGPAVAITPDLLGQWVRNSYFDYAAGGQISAVAVATQTFQAQ